MAGKYRAWPIITNHDGDLLMWWNAGPQHFYDTARSIWTQRGNYRNWGAAEQIVSDPLRDDRVHSAGVDLSGNPCMWLSGRTEDGAYVGTFQFWRETLGTWAQVVEYPRDGWGDFPATQIHGFLAVPGFGLIAHTHGRHQYGIVYSTDGGDTWGKIRLPIESTAIPFRHPVEGQFCLLADGTILCLLRNDVGGEPMWQAHVPPSGDPTDPDDWVIQVTNIDDPNRSPAHPMFHDGNLNLYYVDRSTGRLLWRHVTDPATIIADPTAWPAPVVLRDGIDTGSGNIDAGYVYGVRDDGANHLVWYEVTAAGSTDIFFGRHPNTVP